MTNKFVFLSGKPCRDVEFETILTALLPEPRRPRNADSNPGLRKAWEANVERIRKSKAKIQELRQSGLRMDLNGSRGTLWGALNAILEFVDHHQTVTGARVAYSLLGDGMDFKSRAFKLIMDQAA